MKDKVLKTLRELIEQDVRGPAWRGHFGVQTIADKMSEGTWFVTNALEMLASDGDVVRCVNGLWRLS